MKKCSQLFTACLLLQIILSSSGFISAQENADKKRYLAARQKLIQNERRLNPASKIRLSPDEKVANDYLMSLKRDEIKGTSGSFPPAKNFFLVKSKVAESPLLEIFKKMPKGAILHAHPGAIGDFHWLISDGTYLPNCYIYTGPDTNSYVNGSLAFFKTPPDDNWKLVKDLREAASDKAHFDEKLYQSITLGAEDLTQPDIWVEFEKCWSRVGGLQEYLPVYREFFRNELETIALENVQVLELRSFLGGPSDLDGTSYDAEQTLQLYRQFLQETRTKYPDFLLKIIYTRERAASPENVLKYLRRALQLRKKYPDIIKGFDLVNEEDRSHPLIDFLDGFLQAAREARAMKVGLPYFFHAGESNWTENENTFDALLLNSKRIGHGLALIKHPLLLQRLRQRKIAIEVCPISNQVLGYIADLRNHPAVFWLRSGLPITINPDDPGMMGYTFSYDFYMAFMAWGLDLADLKQLALNSIEYSTLNQSEKSAALRVWNSKWKQFIKGLVTSNHAARAGLQGE